LRRPRDRQAARPDPTFETMGSNKVRVSHLAESTFEGGGLRAHYEYRDLGVAEATAGRFGAHVIRTRNSEEISPAHYHTLEFQIIYILKGWVVFDYEGTGEVRLETGSCAYQPPGIRHAEVAHSADLEILEITMPAQFASIAL
jgi:mannose-6-phosphate isomerase-like protein (cupin superfamily)